MKEVIAQGATRRISRSSRPSYFGLCYQEDRNIIIFEKKNRTPKKMLNTIVHEELHTVYPEFNEREVRWWTDTIQEKLTLDQKKQYFELYGLEYVEEVEEKSFIPQPIGELALDPGL